eukprot:4621065-Pleurochrysis_carterae.AAC.2
MKLRISRNSLENYHNMKPESEIMHLWQIENVITNNSKPGPLPSSRGSIRLEATHRISVRNLILTQHLPAGLGSGTSSGHKQFGWRVLCVVPGIFAHLEALKLTLNRSMLSLFHKGCGRRILARVCRYTALFNLPVVPTSIVSLKAVQGLIKSVRKQHLKTVFWLCIATVKYMLCDATTTEVKQKYNAMQRTNHYLRVRPKPYLAVTDSSGSTTTPTGCFKNTHD